MAVPVIRVAGYIRVSWVGNRGGDGFLSPDLQRERVEAWASYKQARIVDWYIDIDLSGRAGVHRPEFERMMKDAAAGRFDMVAVYKLTRFGRSNKENAIRLDELLALGVGLASVTEDLDTATSGGRFMRNMLFAMAEYESERIGEEWSSIHTARRRKGIAHASRGVYGYEMNQVARPDPENRERTVMGDGAVPVSLVEEEAAAVRGAYHKRLDGLTLYAIRQWLHAQGHRPRSGAEWFASSTVARLLRSPIYAGLVETPDGLVEGTHPAIVSRSVWDRVQALHADPSSAPTRHRSGLAAGLVVCATCGHRMQAHHLRGIAHYRCHVGKYSDQCSRPTMIAQHKLDAWIESEVLKATSQSRLRRGERPRRGREQARQRRLTQAERRVADLGRAIDKLSDERYLLGSLSPAEYERQAGRLLRDREEAERELAKLRSLSARTPPPPMLGPDVWQKATLEQKQRLLRTLIHRVHVMPIAKGGARWVKAQDRARIDWL